MVSYDTNYERMKINELGEPIGFRTHPDPSCEVFELWYPSSPSVHEIFIVLSSQYVYQSTFSQGLWGRDFQRQFPLFLLRSQKILFLPSINHKSDHFEWHLFPQNLTFFHFAFNPRTFWEGTKSLNSFCFMSHHLSYSESSSCISKQKILHHLLSDLIWSNLLTGERVTVVGEYVESVSLLLSVDVFCNIRTIDVFEFHHFLNPQRRNSPHINYERITPLDTTTQPSSYSEETFPNNSRSFHTYYSQSIFILFFLIFRK